MRHVAIDRCRKSAAQKRSAAFCELTGEMAECIPADSDVEDALNAEALKDAVNRFLRRRSGIQQKVFVRRYWFFDSVSDIGRRFGYSENRVKVMLFRMREDLREQLRKEGYTI